MGNPIATGSKPVDHAKVRELLALKTAAKADEGRKKIDAALERLRTMAAFEDATWAQVSAALRSFLTDDPASPRAILLSGPPGTGKSTIARAIQTVCGCKFFARTIADLKMAHIGASAQAAKRLFEEAGAAGRAIVFVDECESILASRSGAEADAMTKELTGVFLPYLEGASKLPGKILFVGATNLPDTIDAAIISRFDLHLKIPVPGPAARRLILGNGVKSYALPEALVDRLVAPTEGMSGRDIDSILRRIRQETAAGATLDAVVDGLVAARRTQGNASTKKGLSWDDVAVDDTTRTSLQRFTKMLLNREKLRAMGLDALPKGVLLWGPPGTGKTQLARVMAATAGCAFHAASSADIKAGFVGQSGQRVKELFSKARATSPCILFVDEIDIVAPARGGGGSADQATSEVVGQLLQEVDGIREADGAVFLMAASNHPDAIDPAVLSRFTDRIEVPLPDDDLRRQIAVAVLRGRSIEGDRDAFIAEVARRTDGASGRDIANLITRAVQRAAERALDEPAGAEVGVRVGDLP